MKKKHIIFASIVGASALIAGSAAVTIVLNNSNSNNKINYEDNELLNESTYDDLSNLFKMFADPTRVKILHILVDKELCVNDLAELTNVTKSAISHQLKSLKLLNLVKYRRDGQNLYYTIADEHVEKILSTGLEHLFEEQE